MSLNSFLLFTLHRRWLLHYSRIDFADPKPELVEKLAQACDVATFGLDNQDVLDETYRKAGKLDTQYFAPKFDPEWYDLLDIIQNNLLDSADAS